MKTVKNFTTTLPEPVLLWLDTVAKETNQQKNEIIENALRLWRKAYIQNKIAESYKDAMNDPEWVELGNKELEEWNELKITDKKYV